MKNGRWSVIVRDTARPNLGQSAEDRILPTLMEIRDIAYSDASFSQRQTRGILPTGSHQSDEVRILLTSTQVSAKGRHAGYYLRIVTTVCTIHTLSVFSKTKNRRKFPRFYSMLF